MIALPKLSRLLYASVRKTREEGTVMNAEPEKEVSDSPSERPKIYVTKRGERYVKADELLRSERGRDRVKAMATLADKQQAADEGRNATQ
jgi:hypothetical protein